MVRGKSRRVGALWEIASTAVFFRKFSLVILSWREEAMLLSGLNSLTRFDAIIYSAIATISNTRYWSELIGEHVFAQNSYESLGKCLIYLSISWNALYFKVRGMTYAAVLWYCVLSKGRAWLFSTRNRARFQTWVARGLAPRKLEIYRSSTISNMVRQRFCSEKARGIQQ